MRHPSLAHGSGRALAAPAPPCLRWAAVLALAFAIRPPAAASSPESIRRPAAEVVLHYLGNEGFALELGGKTVLIDALQTIGDGLGGELPEPIFQQMLSRRAPFGSAALVLVSHPHADHFTPAAVAAFLARHPEASVASSPRILDRLRSQPEYTSFMSRLRGIQTRHGDVVSFEQGGIRVEFLELAHLAAPLYSEPVVAHLLEMGGVRVFHLGDADLSEEEIERFDIAARGVDVAILPYWVFLREGARERIARLLGARLVIAAHLPAAGAALAEENIRRAVPEAVILTRPQEAPRIAFAAAGH